MKTPKTPALEITEDDIRAYAAHLYEQGGRVPGHELEHWLEAESCLRANFERPARRAHRRKKSGAECAHGFTMPASDTALWIEKAGCVGEETGPDAAMSRPSRRESAQSGEK